MFNNSSKDWISIDFTKWESSPNEFNRFNQIKESIISQSIIIVDYISAENIKSTRRLAPLRLMFKSRSWYLWAFCYEKSDYRTFRITRIRSVTVTGDNFERNGLISIVQNKEEKDIITKSFVKLSLKLTKDA